MSNIEFVSSHTAIASIVVRDSRLREADQDIASLAESIARLGQLQPIIVEDDGITLVAGERRLLALKQLRRETIWTVRRSDINEVLALEIELAENIDRLNMTWQERVQAISRIDELRRAQNPNWGQKQTAAVAQVNQRLVSQSGQLVRMMKLFPEIKTAKSLNQAINMAKSKARHVLRVEDVKDNPEVYKEIEERIWLGDSVARIKEVPDESFHLILTDPPFGINYDDRIASNSTSITSYEDSEESYERLLSMAPDLHRTLRPNGFMIWFLGISWYEQAKLVFRKAGFIVDEIPVIWDRSEGRCFTNRPDRYFARSYDIALHCLKGDPQVVQRGKPNILHFAPVGNPGILVERPLELYQELIRRLTVEGEVIADFFVGSGSVPAAAVSMKRQYFGIELDPERRAYAIKKIRSYTPEK